MPATKQRARKVARPKGRQPGAKYPSPLAYPGGKARVLPILLRHIPAGLSEMVSPFIGGGALEITLARQGVRVRAYDAWEHLVCFWKELKRDREGLARAARAYGPPADREVVRRLRREMLRKPDRSTSAQDRAARFFVSSRCSFRGIMTTGGLGGDFTDRSIQKLRDTRVPRKLSVACRPFEQSLGRHPELLAFCDPPYVDHEDLYAASIRSFDHEGLAELLLSRPGPWVLTYGDHPMIWELYERPGVRITPIVFSGGIHTQKDGRRDLIIVRGRR